MRIEGKTEPHFDILGTGERRKARQVLGGSSLALVCFGELAVEVRSCNTAHDSQKNGEW